MTLRFSKYHGCGNDFILLDARSVDPGLTTASVAQLCHRRFGIGADGLILLTDDPAYDFRMRYFNADGNESSMCGNGGRCIVAFARRCGIIKEHYSFIAADGPHEAYFCENGSVRLRMKDVDGVETIGGRIFADTGSPHIIVRVEDLEKTDVVKDGRAIRYSMVFRENGVNVNFVEVHPSGLHVRTYERGVEDETYACGTGVTAVALAAADLGWIPADSSKCRLTVKGGVLEVHFAREGEKFSQVWLEGPATFVFDGTVEIVS